MISKLTKVYKKQNPVEEDVSIGSCLSSSTSGVPAKEPGRDFLDSDVVGDMARPSHPLTDDDDSQDDINFDDGDEEDDEDVDDDDF